MEEPKQEYFKKSLSDFTFDMASGGAIRHLVDRGYTVEQIVKMLDFPTPYDRVQQTVWKYFLDKGTVLLKEPEREAEEEKYGYVTDYDMFGRKSFRRVVVKERSSETIQWRESRYGQTDSKRLLDFLGKKSMENGEDFSYENVFGSSVKYLTGVVRSVHVDNVFGSMEIYFTDACL